MSAQHLEVNVTHNRGTGEVRVIINMDLEAAQDLELDLTRSSTLPGSHAVGTALRQALNGADCAGGAN